MFVSEQKLSIQVLLGGTGGSNVVQLTYIQLVLISLYCTVTYLHMFWQDFPKQIIIILHFILVFVFIATCLFLFTVGFSH